MKLAIKRLVLSNANPAGCAFPPSSIMIEPPHLRPDQTRPGDIYACGRGIHRKDSVMDVVIASALQKSCLSSSTRSSDFVLRQAENKKFNSDAKSSYSIQKSTTQRFIPLAMNHVGLRGGHFSSALREVATQLVTRPEGCPLLRGPFALSHMGAFKKILYT